MMAPAPRFFCAYLYAFRTPFQQIFDKSIYPPIDHTRKALKYQGFFAPKALHTSPMSAHSVTGLFPLLLPGAIRAVFRPVGFWNVQFTTADTLFPVLLMEQGGAQTFIQREDSRPEPAAQQGIGNTLCAEYFL